MAVSSVKELVLVLVASWFFCLLVFALLGLFLQVLMRLPKYLAIHSCCIKYFHISSIHFTATSNADQIGKNGYNLPDMQLAISTYRDRNAVV